MGDPQNTSFEEFLEAEEPQLHTVLRHFVTCERARLAERVDSDELIRKTYRVLGIDPCQIGRDREDDR